MIKMEFTISDGVKLEDTIDWEQLKEDYQNLEMTVPEIKEKYGVTNSQWNRVRRQLKEDGVPLRNRGRVRNSYCSYHAKHYHVDKKSGKFLVRKVVKGEYIRFGLFDTEDEAKAKVEELKANGWKK